MTNRTDTIAPTTPGRGDLPVEAGRIAEPATGPSGVHGIQEHSIPSGNGRDELHCESIASIVSDVEGFTRGWVGRIRRLIHRTSQLIERESLLAGAIARLDQQKAEWNKRTAEKEAGLRDQSKRLTEAWLEVETERRKAIQGARAAATAANKPGVGPVLAAPVAPNSNVPVAAAATAGTPVVAAPPTGPSAGQIGHATGGVAVTQNVPVGAVQAVVAANPPSMPNRTPGPASLPAGPPAVNRNVPVAGGVPATPPMAPVPNTPISAEGAASNGQEPGDDQGFREAEAASRQKIEEFKRMQRAIRSNRNT